MDALESTFRLVVLGTENYGQTAASPELALLVPPSLFDRTTQRLGMERTDWEMHFDKLRPKRTVLIDAETAPGQWKIGLAA